MKASNDVERLFNTEVNLASREGKLAIAMISTWQNVCLLLLYLFSFPIQILVKF